MNTIKSLSGSVAGEAGQKLGEYFQNTSLNPAYQAKSPISWFIRSKFIESLVSRRYSKKNSLKVDGLLVFSEFLERCGDVWN